MNRILRCSPWWRGVVLVALVSVLSGAWLTVVHGSLAEGAACPAESDSSAAHHGVAIGHDRGAIVHHDCSVCHWLRSLRSMTGDEPPMPAGIIPAGIVHPDPIDHEGQISLESLPARSPPA
jgi:hypothetical protein